MKKELRIVFMGSPAFAVASLDILVKNDFNIVGVVTAPDKPAGRGLQLSETAVKKYAVTHGLKILQPVRLKDPQFLQALKALQADLQVVVAFRMLPEVVWNMPPLGTINLHGSLLPQYRGAAPINWAIINGEKETGVTTFKLQQEIDTGNILFAEKISISDDETAGELHDKLMQAGAKLLLKTVQAIANDNCHELPQAQLSEGQELKHAPKLFKEDCRINWNQPVDKVYNFIRGLSPHPTAWTMLNGKVLKIFSAQKKKTNHATIPGSYLTDQKTHLSFCCTDGTIDLIEVQLEGKKRMDIQAFLHGYRFT